MGIRRWWGEMNTQRKWWAAIAGVVVAVSGWMAFGGPLMALSSQEFDEWIDVVGGDIEKLESMCGHTLERSGDERRVHCDRLDHRVPFADRPDASVVAGVDPQEGTIRYLRFHVSPVSPSFESETGDIPRLQPWGEVVSAHLGVEYCSSVEVPYVDFDAWRCDEFAAAHSGTWVGPWGQNSAVLWIGESHRALEESMARRATLEHHWLARMDLDAVRDYLEVGHYSGADDKLARIYGLFAVLDDSDDQWLYQISRMRRAIADEARRERRRYGTTARYPAVDGIVHLPIWEEGI